MATWGKQRAETRQASGDTHTHTPLVVHSPQQHARAAGVEIKPFPEVKGKIKSLLQQLALVNPEGASPLACACGVLEPRSAFVLLFLLFRALFSFSSSFSCSPVPEAASLPPAACRAPKEGCPRREAGM